MPVCEEGELLKKANGLPHQCAHWFAMTERPFSAREAGLGRRFAMTGFPFAAARY